MTDTPAVRVVVVNYNGGATTLAGLRSLLGTDWPADALDLVLVDNGSVDEVAATVARDLPRITVVRSDSNLGFGGGANLALRHLPKRISYVALVNSDVTVPPDWLRPLVTTLASTPELGAACPKILLAGRYEEIKLVGTAAPLSWLDRRRVTARVSGARVGDTDVSRRLRFVDGFHGPEFGVGDERIYEWSGPAGRLLLPAHIDGEARQLRLAARRPTEVLVRTDHAEARVQVGPIPTWYDVPPSKTTFEVVHNVGSELLPSGYVRDRGYLERDEGQYDAPADVFAWCGAAVVLPAAFFDSVGSFDSRLFMYYEDVDLSWRGRQCGWRYVTVPQSVVSHIHMATSSSTLTKTMGFNERNRLVVLTRYCSKRVATAAIVRFLAVTASYFRRDVITRLLRGATPSFVIVALRLRALAGFAVLRLGGVTRSGTGRRSA